MTIEANQATPSSDCAERLENSLSNAKEQNISSDQLQEAKDGLEKLKVLAEVIHMNFFLFYSKCLKSRDSDRDVSRFQTNFKKKRISLCCFLVGIRRCYSNTMHI